jgi:hypothetical protein
VIVLPSYLLNVDDEDIGEDIGFANIILVLDSRSCMYRCCER